MGLDQHAHLRGQKVDWEQYYSDDDYGDQANSFCVEKTRKTSTVHGEEVGRTKLTS